MSTLHTPPTPLRIEYQEVSVKDVMAHFVAGFKADITRYEWFYDAAKGVVVFKLWVRGDGATRDAEMKEV